MDKTLDQGNVDERELQLIAELHKKETAHTQIALCLSRERKIFKAKRVSIEECLKDVENCLLNLYRRKGTEDESR